MEFVTGAIDREDIELKELFSDNNQGNKVVIEGAVHSIRNMGEISFVILRKREGLIQTVFEEGTYDENNNNEKGNNENKHSRDTYDKAKGYERKLREGDYIRIKGIVRAEERAPRGKEVCVECFEYISKVSEALPIPVDKWKLGTSLETKLNHRAIALRNVRERAKFRIQEAIGRGFREYLQRQGFTEVHTPKIGAKSAEGGANMFKLTYFHKPAVLQQSPQLYKQMMVGVFDRVYEVGPVFRAEKHNTRRHLNEYTSMDLEMGYIRGFMDICQMETGFLQYTIKLLASEYADELRILRIELPRVDKIPYVRFDEAKKLVSEKYGRVVRNPFDLEPEEEELIGRYFKEEYDSDFVFVTHYPSKKRPFYAMDDSADDRYTLSFDLLYKGLEITTGGQRIHEYDMLRKKLEKKGMTEEGLEDYLDVFRYGMPPHGGLGIGLERLTMQLLGEDNVREACLFPRDLSRLSP